MNLIFWVLSPEGLFVILICLSELNYKKEHQTDEIFNSSKLRPPSIEMNLLATAAAIFFQIYYSSNKIVKCN